MVGEATFQDYLFSQSHYPSISIFPFVPPFSLFYTIMHYSVTLAALAAFAAFPLTSADGLYSKGSAVLQLNAKNYDKLIKHSNQASVSRMRSLRLCPKLIIDPR